MKISRLSLALVAVLIAHCAVAHASTCRPGTIEYALAQPAGTSVSLDAVWVGRIGAGAASLHAREQWSWSPQLLVIMPSPLDLRPGDTVDVSGTIQSRPG